MSGDENQARQEALSTLHAHYTSLGGMRSGLEPLKLVRISVASKDMDLNETETELDGLETGSEGWVRRRSDFYRTPLAVIVHAEAGPLLRGEWALGADKSVHVVHLGGDRWRRTEFIEGQGEPALALDVDLEPARTTQEDDNAGTQETLAERILRYRLYFCVDDADEGDVRPRHARFCGFFERSQ